MGAHLTRCGLPTVFRHLLSRLESCEVVGDVDVERLGSALNAGLEPPAASRPPALDVY